MNHPLRLLLTVVILWGGLCLMTADAAIENVPIKNASFDEPWDGKGAPPGWGLYAGGAETTVLKLVDVPGGKGLRIEDNDPGREVGVTTTFPVKPGVAYRVTVGVRAVEGADLEGAYIQLRFQPGGAFEQVPLYTTNTEDFEDVEAVGVAPEGSTSALVYFYTHRDPTPKFVLDKVRVESGVPAPQLIPPPPAPVPPQYDKLKDLHASISLVAGGKSTSAIVAPARYATTAKALQQALRQATGVTVPLLADIDPGAALPPTQNLIVLGNRSTSQTSNELYDRFYSLVDLKYPGPGGYVIRTVHNPYGNGFSVVVVGGSDDAGVAAAGQALTEVVKAKARPGEAALGWTMLTKLGPGLKPNLDVRAAETWDDSAMYGPTGYFGWNSISKRMAMYYMWGDEKSAREVVRLAFPDQQALKEIDEIDGERIENKNDPLAGTYHYNSHMMMLFWDLIEESPVFSEAERLKITNAFARQLNHRKDEGVYTLRTAPSAVGSRHGQWSAISLYVLGRYFNKYYPNPVWAQCERGGQLAFQSLWKSAWVNGESDNLFWYNTGTAPVLEYMVLTGDRKPLEVGTLAELLRNQQILVSGLVPDWALKGCAMTYLNQATYLTGDGRWITYRDHCGVDTSIARLGQSFWPQDSLKPALPTDLVNKWTVADLPRPMWQARGSGIPRVNSFQFASYRSAPDGTGDFILLDGFNGASRNPYHTFDLLELRLGGRTLLKDYQNQVLTSADGMVEPKVPMDAALLYRDVVGGTATAVGEVPNMPFCNWRRTLSQRVGKYALICDDLTFRADSQNMKINTSWQPISGTWDGVAQAVKLTLPGNPLSLPGWTVFRARQMECTSQPAGSEFMVPLESIDIMILRAREPGQWLEMSFRLDKDFSGEAFADFVSYVDRGTVQLSLDGKPLGQPFDTYAADATETTLPLGAVKLSPGVHRLRVTVTARRPESDKCYIGFRGLNLKSEGAPPITAPAGFELRGSDVQSTTGGGVINMAWTGAVKTGEHRKVFYLLAERASAEQPLACVQVTPQAAMLALPRPACVVSGAEAGTTGDLVVLATDHLSGHNVKQAGLGGSLLSADQPVDLDWDFAAGKAEVVATADTRLGLRLVPVKGLQLDGMAVGLQKEGDLTVLRLTAGRHTIEAAMPPGDYLAALTKALAEKLAAAQQQRTQVLAQGLPRPQLDAPALAAPVVADLGSKITDLITLPTPQGEILAAAEGKTVHLLAADGKELRRLACDGSVRVLNWWADHQLLLVGCADEKVIAFTLDGARKWVFTSVMDPAVYAAAKPYWFKTAPGHEGIHGLITGTFYGGKSQAFVGSACTLEVLDETGQLVKRLPVFWGPLWKFLFLDKPDKTRDLLILQWLNGSDGTWILNNEKGMTGNGYQGVPSPHTYVGGWSAQQRTALVAADLEGDGKTEVVSCVNGTWNRVTVYALDGTPLYNAQFGAGASNAPNAQMRDLVLADLNGDGKLEIVVGTYEGLVVALDSQCRKLWSSRLPAAPSRLVAMTPVTKGAALLVECQNGQITKSAPKRP